MVTPNFEKVLPCDAMYRHNKKYFTTLDLALTGVFIALWASLQLTIAPLGFRLFGGPANPLSPILCDISAYFTLILIVWVTGKFGVATMVGIAGSIIVLLIIGATQIFGFAASAILFDILCLSIRHKPSARIINAIGITIITVVSAYFAGAIIGSVFMPKTLEWALTFWGVGHAVGGLLSVLIAIPVIGALERAGVRRLIHA